MIPCEMNIKKGIFKIETIFTNQDVENGYFILNNNNNSNVYSLNVVKKEEWQKRLLNKQKSEIFNLGEIIQIFNLRIQEPQHFVQIFLRLKAVCQKHNHSIKNRFLQSVPSFLLDIIKFFFGPSSIPYQMPGLVGDAKEETIIQKCKHLKILDLSHRSFEQLPSSFGDLFPDVEELILSHNSFKNFPDQIFKFSQLKSIDLSHQNEESCSALKIGKKSREHFANLRNLEKLDLSNSGVSNDLQSKLQPLMPTCQIKI